ncbi:MAG: PhoH family protein [Lachnospiraceae bacterium]|nr:PhoH family protein [Lachnospiraceae bacterium]
MKAVFGPFDQLIRILEKTVPVTVVGSEKGVRILASKEEDAERAARALETAREMQKKGMALNELTFRQALELTQDGEEKEALAVMQDVITLTYRGKPVRARTIGQRRYVDAIRGNTVTVCIGPAGTGKTYLAIATAVEALKREEISRIILTRPAVEAGEHLGFLPGDLQSKVDPYLRPLYDGLFEMMGEEKFRTCLERGIIEVAPLAYMRGRTLSNCMVIMDESQNASLEQLFMVLTRLGEGSKMIVTGDITQIDLKDVSSGLEKCAQILKDVEGVGVLHLTGRDVVRHQLVKDIIAAFEAYQAKEEKNKKPENAPQRKDRRR